MQKLLGVLSVAVVLAITSLPLQPARATHQPADKVAVAANNVDVIGPVQLVAGSSSSTVTLLSGSLKTSSPTDLVIKVTLECALQTDVKTVGNADSTAIAAVEVWVEIDGFPVPVSNFPAPDNGRVVFCNRTFQLKTSLFDDLDATIELFLKTRSANAFNWVDLNLGAAVHTIEVKAQLTAQVTGSGRAQAIVGKRTLVVEPEKLANDAQI